MRRTFVLAAALGAAAATLPLTPLAAQGAATGAATGAAASAAASAAQRTAIGAALPADVAERVLARVAEAGARGLPAGTLAARALEVRARGAEPAEVERRVALHAERLAAAHAALVAGGRPQPGAAEIELAATALGKGADAAQVSALARATPAGRPLVEPLAALATLVDLGLPADVAHTRAPVDAGMPGTLGSAPSAAAVRAAIGQVSTGGVSATALSPRGVKPLRPAPRDR